MVELLSKMKTSAETQWFDAGSWAVITQKWYMHSQIYPAYLSPSPGMQGSKGCRKTAGFLAVLTD